MEGNRLFREGLKLILFKTPFDIRWETHSAAEAVGEAGKDVSPGLVIIDPQDHDHLMEDVHLLRRTLPHARIVILTRNFSAQKLAIALEAGADAYLLSGMSPEALVQSLSLVMLGQKVFPTGLAQLLIDDRATQPGYGPLFDGSGLSDREILILRCLASGDANKSIAHQLSINEATVKMHLKAILRKINVRNRTQAAVWAVKQGLEKIPAEVERRIAGKQAVSMLLTTLTSLSIMLQWV
ncbi:MAG TPA: response regulator transcription factor [Alphaproteobacteria bacterium]